MSVNEPGIRVVGLSTEISRSSKNAHVIISNGWCCRDMFNVDSVRRDQSILDAYFEFNMDRDFDCGLTQDVAFSIYAQHVLHIVCSNANYDGRAEKILQIMGLISEHSELDSLQSDYLSSFKNFLRMAISDALRNAHDDYAQKQIISHLELLGENSGADTAFPLEYVTTRALSNGRVIQGFFRLCEDYQSCTDILLIKGADADDIDYVTQLMESEATDFLRKFNFHGEDYHPCDKEIAVFLNEFLFELNDEFDIAA